MLLIAAALGEELDVALGLCSAHSKSGAGGNAVWSATRANSTIQFLKTGIGPKRSGHRLERALAEIRPSQILVIGYAGALDERLKLGDIFIAQRAIPLWQQTQAGVSQETIDPVTNGELPLWQDLQSAGNAAGLEIHLGNILTSAHIVGDPKEKSLLFRRFGARAVDMETAAIAAVAASKGIPIGCVRTISDTADDEFLAPFSHDPSATMFGRASRIASAGNWISRYKEWREGSAVARVSLRHFLSAYLQ